MQCSTSVGSCVWDLSIDEVQNWMFEQCMGCWVLASEKQMVYKWQLNELKAKRLPLASISKYDSKCEKKKLVIRGGLSSRVQSYELLMDKWWVSPVSHGGFYSKIADLRYNTWQYTVDRSRDMIFTNHIYISLSYSYSYIPFHSIPLHYIALHYLTGWWF